MHRITEATGTPAALVPCPVPDCGAMIRPPELCCPLHWHPLTDRAKQSWYHAACAFLRGAITAEELEAARRVDVDPVTLGPKEQS